MLTRFSNLNTPAIYGIMKGWDSHIMYDLHILRKSGDTLIDAIIPAALRTKKGDIPKRVNALLSYPSAENAMKLKLMGCSVKYIFAAASPAEYIGKEVA